MSNAEMVAMQFNVPLENVLRQYARNAKQLREIEAKARSVAPKKYRGKTADEWAADAAKFEQYARNE